MTEQENIMRVTDVEENEDGSADYTFEFSDSGSDYCMEVGIQLLLYAGTLNMSPDEIFDILDDMLAKKVEAEDENPVSQS